ncbi:sorting and assembly machinery component 50 [Anaeramoeba flamelloides]|uniref:Sorting and assembly machinery component 50 n=1 Tax=Anaeramoeba flamelloides TaxID=1746091 RepID=A0AAV7ZF41_9EUKA|nr:sorting and assembly machinery component 50 [Anaeramoeba flamelloides]
MNNLFFRNNNRLLVLRKGNEPKSLNFNQLKEDLDIQEIITSPLKLTKESFVSNTLLQIQQEKTVSSALDSAQKALNVLQSLDIFRNASVTFDSKSKIPFFREASCKVRVNLEEKKKGPNLHLSGGVSGDGMSINASSRYNNIFGQGERFDVTADLMKNSNSFFLNFTKPILSKTKIKAYGLNFGIYNFLRDNQNTTFKEKVNGLTLTFSDQLLKNYYVKKIFGIGHNTGLHTLSYTAELREICKLDDVASWEIREESGASFKSALSYDFAIDKRDNNCFPTKGSFIHTSNQLSGIGKGTKFFKSETRAQMHLPILNNISLGLIGHGGLITPLAKNEKIGILDRFFKGGPLPFRGIDGNTLGKKIARDPKTENEKNPCDYFGGDAYGFFTALLSYKLPLLKNKGVDLGAHLFLTSGNLVSATVGEGSYFSKLKKIFTERKTTTGIGIAALFGGNRVELNYSVPVENITSEIKNPIFLINLDID